MLLLPVADQLILVDYIVCGKLLQDSLPLYRKLVLFFFSFYIHVAFFVVLVGVTLIAPTSKFCSLTASPLYLQKSNQVLIETDVDHYQGLSFWAAINHPRERLKEHLGGILERCR